MKKLDTTLPIYKLRREIEDSIAKNPITILTAETGAGKSTQVPVWMWQKKKKVVVTQPRRIAARSLADYLARITGTGLGNQIGFQTGFDSKQSKATTLHYVTDGVQMIREISGRRDYDILILDEVHEWNLNQEVLMGVVKRNLIRGYYQKSGKRVVIMSATLQADRLSAYLSKAPVISVEGRGYPVSLHHNDPRFLLPDTAAMVEVGRNVLVFQPGKQEIETFKEDLERLLEAEKLKAKILPLHAELSLKDQAKVFGHYPLPKIIVATDIAQTSLTIDDIDAVVDAGLKKELRLVKGIEGLYPVDISRAECMQRAGRAGRVRTGQYFLCADAGIEERMPFPDPEIQRLNLESVVLRLIKMKLKPLDFPFFHAPAKALIFKAIKRLKLLGAITEDERVTEDGKKMADFPVSLRSARLLLEAQKGNPRVLDSAIKCIAIMETKGILNKEFAGEKFANTPYHSDLLNQLMLWAAYRRNRKALNHKKFALATEIYRELNKRLGINSPVKGNLKANDIPVLYRAILSCFADEVHEYTGVGADYRKDNEMRQLDRSSVLFESRPEMVVGFPFDLVILRENRDTGDKEETYIPLITFTSELNLEILEQLKPFSYSKNETVEIKDSKITVHRDVWFGGRTIKSFSSPPVWGNEAEKKIVVSQVVEWLEEHIGEFDLLAKKERLERDFNVVKGLVKGLVKGKLKSFEEYWRGFVFRELFEQLNLDDLQWFFKFHSGFTVVNLGKLLPQGIINRLKNSGWPRSVEIAEEVFEVVYVKGASEADGGGRIAFIPFEYEFFETVRELDLILPTGEVAGVILGDNRFLNWADAVTEYNTWKKRDVFDSKYRDDKKQAVVDDLLDIPFPQAFEGGKGKDNVVLEYFIVPRIEDGEVFLVHFFERAEAEDYFETVREDWEAFTRQYKKSKIDNIFKAKGWKVRG